MKSRFAFLIVLGCMAGLFLLANPQRSRAQSDVGSPQTVALISAVMKQQATIADNQKEVTAKLAEITQSLHIARIYAARSGGGRVK